MMVFRSIHLLFYPLWGLGERGNSCRLSDGGLFCDRSTKFGTPIAKYMLNESDIAPLQTYILMTVAAISKMAASGYWHWILVFQHHRYN